MATTAAAGTNHLDERIIPVASGQSARQCQGVLAGVNA
jgi:hypothetical protein